MLRIHALAFLLLAAVPGLSVAQPVPDDSFPTAERGRYVAKVTDTGPFVPVTPAVTVGNENLRVLIGANGEMQIDSGEASHVVASCFPYPGLAEAAAGETERKPMIGWNGLPAPFTQDNYPDVTTQLGSEASWAPEVKKTSADTATIHAAGECYSLERTVTIAGRRIDVADRFTNLRDVPTGLAPRYRFTAPDDYDTRFSVNLEVAANPTAYLHGPRGGLGLLMQDDLSRMRFRPWVPQAGNRAGFQINRFILDKNVTRTLSWSIYALAPEDGYFDFINRVRNDWNANFTIQGPFCFAYLKPEGEDIKFYLLYGTKKFYLNAVREDPTELREYLKWRGSKILMLSPWLDHEPGAMDHVVTWDEYRKLMGKALPILRLADPDLRLIAGIETDWVAVDPKKMEGGDKIPLPDQNATRGPSVIKTLTPEQSKIIEDWRPSWRDSLVYTKDGGLRIYHYYRGGAPINTPPLNVYPQVGNARYEYLMQQIKLAIDELRMDGVYLDEFPMSQIGSVRNYGGEWDGASADLAFNSGRIWGQYKDCSLAGIQARVNVMNYVLSRGKLFIANRYSTTAQEQSLAANRFTETGWGFNKMDWEDGTKPPAFNYKFFSHLNSPIGLGAVGPLNDVPPAKWLMKVIITYLRHGMVFYHYGPAEPPMTAENKDVFGVIKHMFPITPVELGEGFIIARERILTTISLDRLWQHADKPTVLLFDINGRAVDAAGRCQIEPEAGQWRIRLKLKDWSEIAVVE